MPYWIRDIEGILVKIETPRETELEVCLNIMDVPPEDQNSQHGQEDNFNERPHASTLYERTFMHSASH